MARPRSIDLNADLGEGCGWDAALLERVTSASISCNAHAGNPDAIGRTIDLARANGVTIGAHPGFADRESFGRREMEIGSAEVSELVRDQVQWLSSFAAAYSVQIRYVKPHGALYNQAQRDPLIAEGVVIALAPLGLAVLGLPGSEVERRANQAGLRFVAEGFADRRYDLRGRLVPRSEPGSILADEESIKAQIDWLLDAGIETLCIHGDDPRAIGVADWIIAHLDRIGVSRRSFLEP